MHPLHSTGKNGRAVDPNLQLALNTLNQSLLEGLNQRLAEQEEKYAARAAEQDVKWDKQRRHLVGGHRCGADRADRGHVDYTHAGNRVGGDCVRGVAALHRVCDPGREVVR